VRPVRTAHAALIFACIAAACAPNARSVAPHVASPAAPATSIPALPADALDAPSTPVVALSAGDLANEAPATGAVGAADVASILRETGFVGGASRSFAVPGLRVRTVLARVLRFGSETGARRYLAWVRENVSALDGDGRFAPTAGLPARAIVFLHEPGGCCAKEQATATAVWSRGALVLSVEAIGAVHAADAVRFGTELDGAVGR